MHALPRRGVLTAAGALPFASHAGGLVGRPAASTGYAAATAPDALTRLVLTKPLTRLDQGGSDLQQAMHRNCARIIEQHFARRNERQTAALWGRLTPMDRRILAQAYSISAADTMHQRPPVLLDLLAQRLDGIRLGQVSDHFGFEPVYAALWREAAMFAGGRIVAAFYAGSWAGQQLATLIQNNYPDRWDALGANVSYVMNGFQNIYATTPAGSGQNTQLGNLQSSAAPGFNLNPTEYLLLGGGGDYGVTQEWANLPDAPPPPPGGGCANVNGCPILE